MFSRKHYLQILLWGVCLVLFAGQCANSGNLVPPTPPLPATPQESILRIALLSPHSGEMDTFGRMARNGSIMAFDERNQSGGVLGHHIDWAIYDTNCDYDTAREAARQAIADGYTFIIGPICSEAAIAAAAVSETKPVLMVSPTATHPLVTLNGQGQTRASVFRVAYAWPWQAQAAARFAHTNLQATQAAVLTTFNDDYGATLAHAFTQAFTAQGGNIVWLGSTSSDDPALADKLTAIEQAGATVVYLPVEATIANQVGNLRNTAGLHAITLIGSDSWETSELDRVAANDSYFTTHFALDNPDVGDWANAYKSGFALEPNTLAALGYDAANLLLNSIEQADSFDPVAVAKTLETGNFTGITGPIRFDSQHNPIKPVPIIHINREKMIFVEPVMP